MYADKLEELVDLPQEMFNEFQQSLSNRLMQDEYTAYYATRKFATHGQLNQIREALEKGYVEMSQINLSICSECLHAEYEAEHMVERLVSGG